MMLQLLVLGLLVLLTTTEIDYGNAIAGSNYSDAGETTYLTPSACAPSTCASGDDGTLVLALLLEKRELG